jgi:hypothetical protein
MCLPEGPGYAGRELLHPQRDVARMRTPDGGVEFHSSHGEWIAVLRKSGFTIDALHELYAPPKRYGWLTCRPDRPRMHIPGPVSESSRKMSAQACSLFDARRPGQRHELLTLRGCRRRRDQRAGAGVHPGRTTLVVDGGLTVSRRAGRMGRLTSSPPQFGQMPSRMFSAQSRHQVHSYVQISTSGDAGSRSRSQHSQFGRSSSM